MLKRKKTKRNILGISSLFLAPNENENALKSFSYGIRSYPAHPSPVHSLLLASPELPRRLGIKKLQCILASSYVSRDLLPSLSSLFSLDILSPFSDLDQKPP